MGKANDSGDKNEKATPKKLKDARKEGNIAKSRDLTQTGMTLVWVLILIGLSDFYADRIALLFDRSWSQAGNPSVQTVTEIAQFAVQTTLWLAVVPLAIAAVLGVVIEFLQVGPLLAFKKIAPKGSHIHPVEGFKRMFAKNNFFEAAKALLKTLLMAILVYILALRYLNDVLHLPLHDISRFVELNHHMLEQLSFWVVGAFGFISIVDIIYQKHSHQKRLRMSMYDIRQEHKESEGDPQLKSKRKQLHREWSMQDILQASRNASALVVNPTHIAIALSYEPDDFPLPLVAAKGEGADALRMREAALKAGVPVLRYVPLARELNFRAEYDDVVPDNLFDAVAEVLAWAAQVKQQAQNDDSVELYHEIDHLSNETHEAVENPA